jgi:sodium/bile acid cotransporter 7
LRAWLVRRWFLLLLAAGLSAAVAWPGAVRPWTAQLPMRLIVGLSLLLASWSLEGRQLGRALTRPLSIAFGLGISFAVLPLTAVLLGQLLTPTDLRVGLLIMLCVPCTLSSAVLWTRQAGGDDALALLIVIATNLLGWLATPLWLRACGPVAVDLDFATMMRSLALVLVLPVVLGQALRFAPGFAAFVTRHRGINGVVARVLIMLVLVAAAADAAAQADALSLAVVLTTLALASTAHAVGLCGGFVGGSLAGLPAAERTAVAFAGSQKTLPVALFLYNAFYRDAYPLAVLPLLLYHAAQLILDTLIADRLHRP